MIDLDAATLAFRNRALSVSVATTGSATLSATTTGYARTTGSFVTDGLKVGMEFTPTGFASNPIDIIINVSALSITTLNARAAEVAAPGRTLAVGFPAIRAFEDVTLSASQQPVTGRPYIEESFVHATTRLLTANAQTGTVEETGLYVLKVYGRSGYGGGAIKSVVMALKALFAIGTTLTAGSNTVRVGANPGPYSGQLLPLDSGWSVVTLTVPWRAWSSNAIAA